MPDNEGHRLFNDPLPVEIIGGGGGGGADDVTFGEPSGMDPEETVMVPAVGSTGLPVAALVVDQDGPLYLDTSDGDWSPLVLDPHKRLYANVTGQRVEAEQYGIWAIGFSTQGASGSVGDGQAVLVSNADQIATIGLTFDDAGDGTIYLEGTLDPSEGDVAWFPILATAADRTASKTTFTAADAGSGWFAPVAGMVKVRARISNGSTNFAVTIFGTSAVSSLQPVPVAP